jgi:hypothetical protein
MAHVAGTEGKRRRGCKGNGDRAECHRPNENKMSDGWRGGASPRVEGGVSWKVKNQSRQPFAPSHG